MSRPLPRRSGLTSWRTWTAVAVGAFIGTEMRYLLVLLVPEPAGTFPWNTLSINVLGSLLLGWLTGLWGTRSGPPRWLQAGLGPGLLGSFTTFSAVALVSVLETELLVPYLGLSLLLGLAAAAAGVILGQRSGA
ncbi:fluoride efflux transporter FluC [Arthrobacter tecti]